MNLEEKLNRLGIRSRLLGEPTEKNGYKFCTRGELVSLVNQYAKDTPDINFYSDDDHDCISALLNIRSYMSGPYSYKNTKTIRIWKLNPDRLCYRISEEDNMD